MDFINVIDKLEALVNTSPKVPATRSRLVDAEKVAELLEHLRLSIPQDVRAAEQVLERKDAILNQSQIDARRIKADAEEEYAARLEQNEIMAAARHQAEGLVEEAEHKATRLIEQAETESRNVRVDADDYIIQALRSLEQEMTNVLGSVRKGLDALSANVAA